MSIGLCGRLSAAAALILLLALDAGAQNAEPLREKTRHGEVVVETVASGLAHPWGLAFLPDGAMLVTERPGNIRRISADGTVSNPLAGTPDVAARGQGGLLDIALDPAFATNRTLYITYAEPRQGGAGTAVARARLSEDANGLGDVSVIFRQEPSYSGANHYGSRLAFAPDGTLFVTLGERFNLRDKAQDLTTHLGKVVRIGTDGSAPGDNPFAGRQNARPEIWSYGHRNPQSAAINPDTGELWTIEHGARGGDEINITRKGRNYGWPVITYGVDYSGAKIGEGTAKEGMEQPLYYWDPSIAPSGMAFYTGDAFPQWRGSLFTGALAGRMLVRIERNGDRIVGEERMLRDLGERIRDVRQGPDGFLYLLTDSSDGRVLRLRPAG